MMTILNQETNRMTEPTAPTLAEDWRGASVFAVVMMTLGFAAGLYGLYLTFQDPSSAERLVGGDAFNLQIYAARGLVVMAGGILLVLLGLTAATLGNYRRP